MRSLIRAALAAMALAGTLVLSPAFADTPHKQGGAAQFQKRDPPHTVTAPFENAAR